MPSDNCLQVPPYQSQKRGSKDAKAKQPRSWKQVVCQEEKSLLPDLHLCYSISRFGLTHDIAKGARVCWDQAVFTMVDREIHDLEGSKLREITVKKLKLDSYSCSWEGIAGNTGNVESPKRSSEGDIFLELCWQRGCQFGQKSMWHSNKNKDKLWVFGVFHPDDDRQVLRRQRLEQVVRVYKMDAKTKRNYECSYFMREWVQEWEVRKIRQKEEPEKALHEKGVLEKQVQEWRARKIREKEMPAKEVREEQVRLMEVRKKELYEKEMREKEVHEKEVRGKDENWYLDFLDICGTDWTVDKKVEFPVEKGAQGLEQAMGEMLAGKYLRYDRNWLS